MILKKLGLSSTNMEELKTMNHLGHYYQLTIISTMCGRDRLYANLFYTNQPTYLPTLQPIPTYLTT